MPNGATQLDGVDTTYGITGSTDYGPTAPGLPDRTQDAIVAALKANQADPAQSAWPTVSAALYSGLRTGIPLPLAIIEALLQQVFDDVTAPFASIGDALGAALTEFGQKWLGLQSAQDTANYAAAQLAVKNRLIVDLFDGAAGPLGTPNWAIASLGGSGYPEVDGVGNVGWHISGGATGKVGAVWAPAMTTTDYQVISAVMPQQVQDDLFGNSSYLHYLGRVKNTGTLNTWIDGRAGFDGAAIGCMVSGTPTIFGSNPVTTGGGDTWDFYIGDPTTSDPNTHVLIRNGVPVITVGPADGTTAASTGSGFRRVGFIMEAGDRGFGVTQTLPGSMAVFSADDQ